MNASLAPPTPDALLVEQVELVRSIYEWVIPAMIVILLLAVVGNGLIVLSSPFLSAPVSPYLRLCVSLSAADMWAASLLIAGLLVNSYLPVVVGVRKETACADAVLEAFRVAGMLTSDWHLFALAVNQFIGTMYPLKYRMIVTTRRLRLLTLSLWIVPLVIVFAWFTWSPSDGLRHPRCVFDFYNRFPFRLAVFLLFTLPLLATLVLYTLIVANLLKEKAEFKAKEANESCSSGVHRGSGKTIVHSKLKLVWTTLLIVSTFSLSWGVCVLYFTLVCQKGCLLVYRVSLSFYTGLTINSLVNCLVMLKLAANPFIYTLRIKKFKSSVACLARKLRGADPRSSLQKREVATLLSKNSSRVSQGQRTDG